MAKAICLSLTILLCFDAFSQTGFVALKKRGKTVQLFYKGGPFTFQTQDGKWITGEITAIRKDSFYFTQEIVRYALLGSDTAHFGGQRFSLLDVRAVPTKKEELVFHGDQLDIILGHEKWVWVRNGLLFQIAGAGYAGLRAVNAVIRAEPPFSKKNLKGIGIGAAAFVVGTLMHFHFDPYIRLGKKYRLECLSIPVEPGSR